jgi:hypothetical protein
MQVWHTPVRQDQRVGMSQASARSRREAWAGDHGVVMPLRAKVMSGPVPVGPGGWCGRIAGVGVTPGLHA